MGLSTGKTIIMTDVNGMTFDLNVNEYIQSQMANGSYEPTQTAWARECLVEGDTFIDVGANAGWYTSLGSKLVGPTGKVIAIEPSPVARSIIEKAIVTSNTTNVQVVAAAAGREAGKAKLYVPNKGGLHSPSVLTPGAIGSQAYLTSYDPVDIDVVTIDSLFDDLPKIKLVKLDVEGFEPDVIAGMSKLLANRCVENIFCEFNSAWLSLNNITPNELSKIILDHGFVVKKTWDGGGGVNSWNGQGYSLKDEWFTLS
jgi:FkbM family methyltransferase